MLAVHPGRGRTVSFAKLILVGYGRYFFWIFRFCFRLHEYGQSIRRSSHRIADSVSSVSIWLDHLLFCRCGLVGAWCSSLAACGRRACSGARSKIISISGKGMNPMKIKPRDNCRWDLVSLGEVMLRLDPGDSRISTTRQFRAWEE